MAYTVKGFDKDRYLQQLRTRQNVSDLINRIGKYRQDRYDEQVREYEQQRQDAIRESMKHEVDDVRAEKQYRRYLDDKEKYDKAVAAQTARDVRGDDVRAEKQYKRAMDQLEQQKKLLDKDRQFAVSGDDVRQEKQYRRYLDALEEQKRLQAKANKYAVSGDDVRQEKKYNRYLDQVQQQNEKVKDWQRYMTGVNKDEKAMMRAEGRYLSAVESARKLAEQQPEKAAELKKAEDFQEWLDILAQMNQAKKNTNNVFKGDMDYSKWMGQPSEGVRNALQVGNAQRATRQWWADREAGKLGQNGDIAGMNQEQRNAYRKQLEEEKAKASASVDAHGRAGGVNYNGILDLYNNEEIRQMQEILNGNYSEEEKQEAEERLYMLRNGERDDYGRSAAERANEALWRLENEYDPDDKTEQTRDAQRRMVYDLMNGDGAYDGLDAEERQQVDAAIDQATGNVLSGQSDHTLLENEKSNVRTINNLLKQLDYQDELERRYNELMAGEIEGDGTWDPAYSVQHEEANDAWDTMSMGSNVDDVYNLLNPETANWTTDITDTGVGAALLMDDEMKEKFISLYKANKKDEAWAFFEGVLPYLNQAYHYFEKTKQEEEASRNPVISTLGTMAAHVMQPAEFLANLPAQIKALINGEQSGVTDPYSSNYALARYKNTVRNKIAENIGDMGWMYSGIMSGVDSGLNVAIGKGLGLTDKALEYGVLALFFTQSFDTSLQNAMVEGNGNFAYDVAEAFIDSAIDTVTEIASVERWLADPTNIMTYLIKVGVSEASEEAVGAIAEPYIKQILGHKHQYNERADQIWAQGGYNDANGNFIKVKDWDDAKRQALREWNHDIRMAAQQALLSVGPAGVYGSFQIAQNNRNVGRTIQNQQYENGATGLDTVLEAAKGLDTTTKSFQEAQKIGEKLEQNKKVRPGKVGQLASDVMRESQEQAEQKAADALRNEVRKELAGKEIRGSNAEEMTDLIVKALDAGGIENLTKKERDKIHDSAVGYNTLVKFQFASEQSSRAMAAKTEATQAERKAMQSVSDALTQKKTQTVADDFVGKQLATQDDIDRAEGKRTRRPDEVIVDRKFGKLEGMELDEKSGEWKYRVNVDGKTELKDASEIKATNFSTAAIVRSQLDNPGFYSGDYTNELLKQINSQPNTRIGDYMREATNVRLKAFLGKEIPQTKAMTEAQARELYRVSMEDSRREWQDGTTGRAANYLGEGKGRANFDGVEFGSEEWNKKLDDMELSQSERDAVNGLAGMAVQYGMNFNFVDQIENNDYIHGSEAQNGITIALTSYDSETAKKAGRKHDIIVTVGHEMTHWLRRNNAAGYIELQDYVLKAMGERGVNVEERILTMMERRASAGDKLNISGAIEEIVANACDQVMASKEAADYLQKNSPKLYEKIRDYVKDLVKRITSLFKTGDAMQSASRDAWVMASMGKQVNELHRIWWGKFDEVLSGQVKEMEAAQPAEGQTEKTAASVAERYSIADEEYAAAVERKDWRTAENMLMDRYQQMEKDGLVGYNAPHFFNGDHAEIARKIKSGDQATIRAVAEEMAQQVPENAVLIPMPPHTGVVTDETDTMILAKAIAEITGRPVATVLESDEHMSRNAAKKQGVRGVTADSMGFRKAQNVTYGQYTDGEWAQTNGTDYTMPDDAMPVFIDNVVGGGVTAQAARNAIGRGITLAYAQSSRSKIQGAKVLSVTYDSEGKLIPLSERMDASNPSWKYSISEDNGFPAITDSEGNVMAEELPGGSFTMYSRASWEADDIDKLVSMLVDRGFSERKVKKWVKDVNDIAAIIASNPDRYDYLEAQKNTKNKTMLKNNQEYIKTLDASTLCAKRLLYQGIFNEIQHMLPNTPLLPGDLIDLVNKMKKNGLVTPCAICYVESRRRMLGSYAQKWINEYKGEYVPRIEEVTTTDGLEKLRTAHPQAYQDFIDAMNAKGSANPKVVQLRTDYKSGEIRNMTEGQIKKVKEIGGLRVQSFSDFETIHLIDMMQAVMDMAAMDLTSQAYTKVPNFAWVFGDTGMKINLSLIGEGKGVDENGKLIFSDTEGMPIKDAMDLRKAYSKNVGTILVGMNDEHIIAAMGDDRIDFIIPFHKSGWSKKEMGLVYGMSTYKDYTKTQNEKRIAVDEKGNVIRRANGKGYVTVPNKTSKLTNIHPVGPKDALNGYWEFNHNGEWNANKYLQLCAQDKRLPKFPQFLVDNGDGSFSLPKGSDARSQAIRKGYWKLLIDFKMYDNNGKGSPQTSVQPNFNMDAAMEIMTSYNEDPNKLPTNHKIAQEFVDEYKAKHPGRKMYSMAEEDNGADVGHWMMGLTESSVHTEGERALIREYRGLKTSLELCQEKQANYKKEMKPLLDKKVLDIEERDRLTILQNRMQIEQDKQARIEQELYDVTRSEGYAGMMYRNSRIFDDYVNGKNQQQVEAAVDTLINEAERAEKDIEQRQKAIRKLADDAAVSTIRRELKSRGLSWAANGLKKNYFTAMSTGEIEGRLAEIVLKAVNGEDITAEIESLASDMTTNGIGFGSEIAEEALSNVRGMTIEIGPGQQAEMKANHLTLKDLRERTKGSGVTFKYGPRSTLDINAEEIGNLIPELRESLANEKQSLGDFVDWIERQLAAKKGNAQDYGVNPEEVAVVITACAQQMLDAEQGGMSPADLKKRIAAAQGEIGKLTEAVEGLMQSAKQIRSSAMKASNAAGGLRADAVAAIDYYNLIARQAAETERMRVKRDVIEKLRSENTKKLIEQQMKFQEMMKKDRRARELQHDNEQLRKVITTDVKRLKDRLIAETDQKNVQEEAKPLARQLVSMLVDHDMAGWRHVLFSDKKTLADVQMRLAKMEAANGSFDMDADLDFLVIKAPNAEDNDYSLKDKVLEDLMHIEQGLQEYRNAEGRGNVSLADRKAALEKVQEAVSEIYDVIRARETAFIMGQKRNVLELATQMERDMAESRFRGERKGRRSQVKDWFWNDVGYGNLTPEYFIKNLRNRTLSVIYEGMHEAEKRSGLEARDAKARIAQIAQATGYATWDGQEKKTVTLSNGKQIQMSVEQLMALYATWNREKNALRPEETSHLLKGGFVLTENDTREGKARRERSSLRPIRVNEADLNSIGSYLTDQQKQYADAIVEYMSTDLAKIGNEASLRTYGIRKFTESYYFPTKSWGGVLNQSSASGISNQNENRAMRQSFTKRIQAGARNALEIGDFTPTAMKHITGMITFNTVGPAVENLNKVLNQQLDYYEDEEMDPDEAYKRNVRTAFEENYGKMAYNYLKQFMQDVNGGVARRNETIMREKLLSLFKKNAVAGSLSVAAQQPLSYIRAAMLISPKYLAQAISPQYWRGSYEEMMSHSGVAVIKEMGKFDMNFGQSMTDYITPDGMKTTKDRIKAAGEVATALPAKMDAMTWTRMWSACKLEQAALHPEMDVKSEEFLDMVADRFEELMRRTQVYDSVMVKSQNMRSDNYLNKIRTSFMAEPTLSLNVLADAWMNMKEKGGKANAAKALSTFILSAAAQAGAKAFFGTGRSPDKKKNQEENFLNKFLQSLLGEINPFGLIPGYSQLTEAFINGELSDDAMGMIGKAKDAMQRIVALASGDIGKKGLYRDLEDSVGQLVQIATDVPLKNFMRDFRAMVNWFSGGTATGLMGDSYADRETSAAVLKQQSLESLMTKELGGLLNSMLGEAGYKTDNTSYVKRIYEAQKKGDNKTAAEIREYMETVKMSGKDPGKWIDSQLNAMLKEDDSLSTEEKMESLGENGYGSMGKYINDQYRAGEIDRKTAEEYYKKENPTATDKDVAKFLDKTDWEKAGKPLAEGQKNYTNYTPLYVAMQDNKVEDIRDAVEHMKEIGYTEKDIKKEVNGEMKKRYMAADANERIRLKDAMEKAYKALGFTAEDADKTISSWTKEKK